MTKTTGNSATRSAFYDVDQVDGDTYQVVAYKMLDSGKVWAAECAVVSAFGEWREDQPEQRIGDDGEPCRSGERACSDANEIAGAFNGGLMCAGVFNDGLAALYLLQQAGGAA